MKYVIKIKVNTIYFIKTNVMATLFNLDGGNFQGLYKICQCTICDIDPWLIKHIQTHYKLKIAAGQKFTVACH